MHWSPFNRRIREAGFTLIELLVVIAILAILAAFLFPVFSQAKKAGKTSVTLSNLKQLGTAFALYEQDNDDFFPSATDGPLGIGRTGGWVWYDAFEYNGHGHFDVSKGTIYPYVKSTKVYLSPNDGEGDTTGLSFSMNGCLVNTLSGTGLTPSKSTTVVPFVAATMLLGEEGTGFGNDHTHDSNDGYFSAPNDHFAEWHAAGTAILFTDLHAKIRKAQDDATIAALTSGGAPALCSN